MSDKKFWWIMVPLLVALGVAFCFSLGEATKKQVNYEKTK